MLRPPRLLRLRPRCARLAPALGLVLLPLAFAGAQQGTGTIVGRVVDARSGAGLTDVGVQVVGTTLGMQTGIDGRYTIRNAPAGTITIQARRIGYTPKTVTGAMLTAGTTLELDVVLEPATVRLSAQVVTAAAERGSVNAALDAQRTASGVVNAVTREQIARSPDADAAQAVQRVSGVTVEDGKYVFVRGLGERYTTATLNGSRIPSPEPERKVVPLDLFPAGLLQSVTTSKTFTPDQSGDFSGASVDIRTREFPAERQVSYSLSTGYNDAATNRRLPFAPMAGHEWLALVGGVRDIPIGLRAAGNLQTPSPSQTEQNSFINSLRDVWRPSRRAGAPSSSFGVTVGGSDPLLGQRIGYVASLSYAYTDEARLDAVRAVAIPGSSASSPVQETNRFAGTTGRSSVLWGGLLNLSTLVGARTRLALDNTYNRTADNDATVERGYIESFGLPAQIEKLQYVERSVRSSQLRGEHDLGAGHRLDWAVTSSGVTRREPDRSEFVAQIDTDATTGLELLRWNSANEGAVRTFANLDERTLEGKGDYTWEIGAGRHRLRAGGLTRHTSRDADNRAYNIVGYNVEDSVRALPPETLFGGRFTAPDSSRMAIQPLGQGGSYTARDQLGAGYLMAELELASWVRLVAGGRYESSNLRVDARSTLGSPTVVRRQWNDVLPSLALNFSRGETQNFRLSASRTLARPEYREVTDIAQRDVVAGETVRGNPNLQRTLIDNYDARWEWYPDGGEVLSLGVFAKRFTNPIEKVARPSSGEGSATFVNAESAENYGVELEARKRLGFLGWPLDRLTVFSNLTMMESRIHLGASEASSTNQSRRMVGQAPYVVNAGLTYAGRDPAASATVLYNRVGERIESAGERPLPDAVIRPRDVLDLSLRFPLRRGVTARLDGKNLLDAPYEIRQGIVTRESYHTGRGVTFGFNVTR